MSSGGGQPHAALALLAGLNELTIKAFSSKNRESLVFLMLNDTARLIRYDRAMLWDLHSKKPSLYGVSGQTTFSADSEVVKNVQKTIEEISKPQKLQVLAEDSFKDKGKQFENQLESGSGGTVLWIPIIVDEKISAGLWLERWNQVSWHTEEQSLAAVLARGYSAAWHKFKPLWHVPEPTKWVYKVLALTILVLILFIPTPLRIVASCEVVAKDPYLITAPLDGIIEEVIVLPGEQVEKDQVLFTYDKRVPLQELKVAQKQFAIAQSQLNRIMTQGYNDPEALNEAAIWRLQLDRDQIKLDLAEYQASQLEVKAPINGLTAFDDPEDWRGRPVQVGEKVMVLVNPEKTKLKIWIGESDNIALIGEEPIKVFLNIDPAKTYTAEIVYVADYSLVNEKGITSFVAEADWIEGPENVKIGLKGTAVLYGEYVPLVYWILRKPWNAFRQMIGW